MENADDDKYRKIGSVRKLFEESNRDYYKPEVIDRGFAGEFNNYIKYVSEGDKMKHYHLNMIRQDSRDLINKHKPIEILNNNDNTDTNNNNKDNANDNNNDNDNENDCGEWKTRLRMYIKCISIKSFNVTRTMHPKSKQVEVYMGSDTKNVIDTLFNTLLENFQRIQETSNERGSEFITDSVEILGYEFHKIGIIRAESI